MTTTTISRPRFRVRTPSGRGSKWSSPSSSASTCLDVLLNWAVSSSSPGSIYSCHRLTSTKNKLLRGEKQLKFSNLNYICAGILEWPRRRKAVYRYGPGAERPTHEVGPAGPKEWSWTLWAWRVWMSRWTLSGRTWGGERGWGPRQVATPPDVCDLKLILTNLTNHLRLYCEFWFSPSRYSSLTSI